MWVEIGGDFVKEGDAQPCEQENRGGTDEVADFHSGELSSFVKAVVCYWNT
jgi:hypothetical protein